LKIMIMTFDGGPAQVQKPGASASLLFWIKSVQG